MSVTSLIFTCAPVDEETAAKLSDKLVELWGASLFRVDKLALGNAEMGAVVMLGGFIDFVGPKADQFAALLTKEFEWELAKHVRVFYSNEDTSGFKEWTLGVKQKK
jgi:hypothetical protein